MFVFRVRFTTQVRVPETHRFTPFGKEADVRVKPSTRLAAPQESWQLDLGDLGAKLGCAVQLRNYSSRVNYM